MAVECSDDELRVSLTDGRTLSIPVAWFPRLLHASPTQRADYELLGDGQGIHWPAIDEDISVMGLLAAQRSVESNATFA
jgi:hypothetical protein